MVRNEIDTRRGEGSDLYIDHTTLRRPDPYYPFYLTAFGIAKSDFIEERMGIARRAGVTPVEVVPTPFALMAAYRHAYGVEGGVIMLVNIGGDNTDLVLVRGGRMIFGRNISQGARVFDDQIKAMGGVGDDEAEFQKVKYGTLGAGGTEGSITERIRPAVRQAAYQFAGILQSTLTYARNQLDEKDLQVDKVYLSGGGARLSGLDVYLKSALKAEVEWLDPFRNIDTAIARSSGEEEIGTRPSDLAVAVGLAHIGLSRHSHAALSLVPDRVRERRRFFSSVPFLVAACAALAVTLGFLTVTLKVQQGQIERTVGQISAQIRQLEADQQKLEELENGYRQVYAKLDTLQGHAAGPRQVMEIYSKLRRLWREGIQFEKIEFKETNARRHAIVNVPDQGHVAGVYQGEDEENVTLKDVGPMRKGALLSWEVPRYRLALYGEIEENIRGGANETLVEIGRQLTDPNVPSDAKISRQDPSTKRPGWRAFTIEVTFP
jgi:cell division ATPase FtsA